MDNFPVCTHCGFTFGEYRARGLLGCPHCYAGFGEALQGDIAWLHQALAITADTGSGSSESAKSTAPAAAMDIPAASRTLDEPTAEKPDPETPARLRELIAAAVRIENYEEAARLNRILRSIDSMGSGPGLGLA